MKKKINLIMLVLLVWTSSYSQVADSVYYNRLFYVCKAWGYAKYHHTEIANGSVNWDDVLLNTLTGIKSAPDNTSFNDSLLLMLNNAGVMEISSVPLPTIIDSLNNISDYSWIQNSIFSDTVKGKLDTIRSRFRPQSNVYVDEALGADNPTFDTDDLYYSEVILLPESKRILALFRYWNIINYFYPYKNIMDQNWDSTLVEFIPQIVENDDPIQYTLAFKELTTRINDSHASFSAPAIHNIFGNGEPPFLLRFIENETVVTRVSNNISGISQGDIIKKIDGIDIYYLRDSLRRYTEGSNDEVIDRNLNNYLINKTSGSNFTVEYYNGIETITSTFIKGYYPDLYENTNPIWQDTLINESCSFGIVDMGRLENNDIPNMFNDLWNTDAIIFDLRNYPNGTLWEIVNYLYPSSINIANFTIPDITYPGRKYWKEEYIGSGTSSPYEGKIILLFDERTQSQAEYTCMGLEQFPDAIKIGSTTAAADGNVSEIYLPGNIYTYATFLGTYYPDYTQTQRVGIVPDFEVHPTILGIRNEQDEVLNFALNCDFVNIKEIETTSNLKLYPNPAKNEICYDLTNENPTLIELYDIQGHKIKVINVNSSSGIIDISDVNNGTYLIKIYTNKTTESKLIIKY